MTADGWAAPGWGRATIGMRDEAAFTEALNRCAAGAESFGLLLVELRGLERTSLAHGWDVGEALAAAAAERLRALSGARDQLARLAPARFAVIQARPHDRLLVRDVAAALAAPFEVAGRVLQPGYSIGMGFFPGDGRTAPALRRNVTLALHAARAAPHSAYRFYAAGMEEAVRMRAAIEHDLGGALERGELHVRYQPQIHLASGAVAGCEALLRWRHPRHGLIPPARFIRAAEASGLIGVLGDWVLARACEQLAAWTPTGVPPRQMAVNVSARQLADTDFPARVARILAATGAEPRQLQLEVTESVALQDPDTVTAVVNRLRALGVTLAIDDFGAGFSAFNALNLVPAHALKLDARLIAALGAGGRGERTVVDSAVRLGHSLGMFVIAEGVETADQLAAVEALDCDLVQGHCFAAEMSGAALRDYLAGCPPDAVAGGVCQAAATGGASAGEAT